MIVPGDDLQLRVFEPLSGVQGALQRHRLVLVPVDQQHRPLIPVHGLLRIDGLGHPDIVPLQLPPVPGRQFLRNVLRIEVLPQQRALPGAFGNHQGWGQGNQAADQIPGHARRQRHRQAPLGVAAQVQIRHEIQRPGIAHQGQDIGQPFIQRMVLEAAVALPVAVHVRPEHRQAHLVEGPGRGPDVGLLLVSGKSVDQDHQGAFLPALFRPVQRGVQLDSVFQNIHPILPPGSFSFLLSFDTAPRVSCLRGPRNSMKTKGRRCAGPPGRPVLPPLSALPAVPPRRSSPAHPAASAGPPAGKAAAPLSPALRKEAQNCLSRPGAERISSGQGGPVIYMKKVFLLFPSLQLHYITKL